MNEKVVWSHEMCRTARMIHRRKWRGPYKYVNGTAGTEASEWRDLRPRRFREREFSIAQDVDMNTKVRIVKIHWEFVYFLITWTTEMKKGWSGGWSEKCQFCSATLLSIISTVENLERLYESLRKLFIFGLFYSVVKKPMLQYNFF